MLIGADRGYNKPPSLFGMHDAHKERARRDRVAKVAGLSQRATLRLG